MAVHWRLILAAVVAAVVGSAAWLVAHPAKYSAHATFLVAPLPTNQPSTLGVPGLEASSLPSQTVASAAAVLRSPVAATQAAAAIGHGWTAPRILSAIAISPSASTSLVTVTATASSPTLAIRMANAYARAVVGDRARAARTAAASQLAALATVKAPSTEQQANALAQRRNALEFSLAYGDPTLLLLHPATGPATSTGPSLANLLLLALAVGLVLGGAGAFFLERTSTAAVADENELVSLTGLPIFGRVPWSRAYAQIVVSGGWAPEELTDAMQAAIAPLQLQQPPPQLIMVTSLSTGDGETACAIGLAEALTRRGAKVVLLDLDTPAPKLAGGLDLRFLPNLRPEPVGSSLALSELLVDHPQIPLLRVAFLAGVTSKIDEALLRQLPIIFADARRLADYVIVLAPPWSETLDGLYITDAVDSVLVAARPNRTSAVSAAAARAIERRAHDVTAGLVLFGGRRQSRARAAQPVLQPA